MNIKRTVLASLAGFVCLLAPVASTYGEAAREELPEKPRIKADSASSTMEPRRDPFQTTDVMRELAKDGSQPPRPQRVETDTQASIKLPKISIKAYVSDGVQPAVVLLDVDKLGTFFVRQGSLLEIQIDGQPAQLVIGQLSSKGLEIELKNSGTKLLIP